MEPTNIRRHACRHYCRCSRQCPRRHCHAKTPVPETEHVGLFAAPSVRGYRMSALKSQSSVLDDEGYGRESLQRSMVVSDLPVVDTERSVRQQLAGCVSVVREGGYCMQASPR